MIIERPTHMRSLPADKHGRPIPAFVEWIDGKPDFRIMRAEHLRDAHRFGLCWVCGKKRGRIVTFVIGPMCTVNHVSAEPPSHKECAIYSARACPFLSTPQMVRRDRNLEELGAWAPGVMIERNPGVTALWTTRAYTVFRTPDKKGSLFDIGEPLEVAWYTQGRLATRNEVQEAFELGLPQLRGVAEAEGDDAVELLEQLVAQAMTWFPEHERSTP